MIFMWKSKTQFYEMYDRNLHIPSKTNQDKLKQKKNMMVINFTFALLHTLTGAYANQEQNASSYDKFSSKGI